MTKNDAIPLDADDGGAESSDARTRAVSPTGASAEPQVDPAHRQARRSAQVYAEFDSARAAYMDLLLEEIAAEVRERAPGAVSIVVEYPSYDYDGAHMHFRRALDAAGVVLVDIEAGDQASADRAEEISEEIDSDLDALAGYGFKPDDGAVIVLRSPSATPPGLRFDPTTHEGRIIADLWDRVKTIEEPDGGWPGAEVVDVLSEFFDRLGYDLTPSHDLFVEDRASGPDAPLSDVCGPVVAGYVAPVKQ